MFISETGSENLLRILAADVSSALKQINLQFLYFYSYPSSNDINQQDEISMIQILFSDGYIYLITNAITFRLSFLASTQKSSLGDH